MARGPVAGWREVTLDGFKTEEDGIYWRTRATVLWRLPAGLSGIFCTAAQSPDDLEETWRAAEAYRPDWRFFSDARGFRASSSAVFDTLLRRGPDISRLFWASRHRNALVLPSDWSHAWWRGALALPGMMPRGTMITTDVEVAWRYLDASTADAQRVLELTTAVQTENALMARAEDEVRADPTLDLAGLARRLSVSTRALQRELARVGVSFAALRLRARLERAVELVRETNEKVESIAAEVGFRSRAHFGTWFRHHTGETPAGLRARAEHRAGEASQKHRRGRPSVAP